MPGKSDVFCLPVHGGAALDPLDVGMGSGVFVQGRGEGCCLPTPYGAAAPVILMQSLGPRARCPQPWRDPAQRLRGTQSSPGTPSTLPCPMGPLGPLRVVGSDLPLYLLLRIFIHFLRLDLSGERW